MKSQSEIQSENLSKNLNTIGIDNHFSVSNTDFGSSCYFTFYKNESDKLVIRISDHSVSNSVRIANEFHVNCSNVNVEKLTKTVELYLFPERFEFVACSENFTHRINGIFGKFNRKN